MSNQLSAHETSLSDESLVSKAKDDNVECMNMCVYSINAFTLENIPTICSIHSIIIIEKDFNLTLLGHRSLCTKTI